MLHLNVLYKAIIFCRNDYIISKHIGWKIIVFKNNKVRCYIYKERDTQKNNYR